MTGKTITVRANRSFSTIARGDVFTINETDARLQAFVASGYLVEVEGDEAKGAKKIDSLVDSQPAIVWDGTPGNRRGATVQETDNEDKPKTAPVAKATAAKESNGAK